MNLLERLDERLSGVWLTVATSIRSCVNFQPRLDVLGRVRVPSNGRGQISAIWPLGISAKIGIH